MNHVIAIQGMKLYLASDVVTVAGDVPRDADAAL